MLKKLFLSLNPAKTLTTKTPHHLPNDHFDPPFTLANPITNTKPKKKKKNPAAAPKPQENPPPVRTSALPFDFRYSYSETNPDVGPIGYREPKRFSPFVPGRLDREWTGTAAPAQEEVDWEKVEKERARVLGDPLSKEEVAELVERYRHNDCSRQINLGKGGVTHNMLDDIHNHWKKAEADKSGGKIIYHNINVLLLYRGRNYDPKNRPVIPLMLWKPYPPIYPKLVKNVADGLTFEETKALRNTGLNSPAVMKITRNGVYVNVVGRVRAAFETEKVVRLDCTHVGTSDCKRIGLKLKDLVPCVPILFKDEQIILWRGKSSPEEQSSIVGNTCMVDKFAS